MKIRQHVYFPLFILFVNFLLTPGIINLPGLDEPEFPPEKAAGILKIEEEGWSDEGFEYRKVIAFDEAGRILSETFFDDDENEGSRIAYYYDNLGRIASKEFHHPNARVPDNEEYVWDEDGRLFSVARIYTTGKYGWRFEYTYDDEGRLILVTKIDRYWKDVVVWEKIYLYDFNGRIIGSEGGGLDENIHWYDTYSYDPEGRLWGMEKYDVHRNLVSRTLYSYGEDNRIFREEYFNGEGESVRAVDFYYRNNGLGFWAEKQIGVTEASATGSYFRPVSKYIRTFFYRDID